MYLSATKTLFCHREMELNRVYFLHFAQTVTINDFQNTIMNSQWHCFQQMPQKTLWVRGGNAGKERFLRFELCFLPYQRWISSFELTYIKRVVCSCYKLVQTEILFSG